MQEYKDLNNIFVDMIYMDNLTAYESGKKY